MKEKAPPPLPSPALSLGAHAIICEEKRVEEEGRRGQDRKGTLSAAAAGGGSLTIGQQKKQKEERQERSSRHETFARPLRLSQCGGK